MSCPKIGLHKSNKNKRIKDKKSKVILGQDTFVFICLGECVILYSIDGQ